MQETRQNAPKIESFAGLVSLMVAHCAGMLDLVALPLWVGTLVAQYHFNPQQAGGAPTLFLTGAALSSLFFAPRLNRLDSKRLAVSGFAVAALVFLICSRVTAMSVLGPLHFVGGVAAGTALSFTHGTIGHARNPHRVFAIAGLAIGIYGIVFLGGMPGVIARFGGPSLFIVFFGTMGIAALLSLLWFPSPHPTLRPRHEDARPLSPVVWLAIVAIALMAMTQAMTLSFYERIGMARGFGHGGVTLALVIYGVVTLFPSPLAGLLENRVKATTVISTVPVVQAVCALIITHTLDYTLYVASGALMAFAILFTHTYAFGLLARLDPSGRAVAGTPAMLMVGAAIAPFLGGTLVRFIGFEAIGYAAVALVAIELSLFNRVRRSVQRQRSDVEARVAT